ncbi:hypothetical protein JVU11DRAFT_11521 [Chiua virens]|nr:hypothetical protein JVU11DRAFT_11521 [Chiua virens]
MDTNLSCYSCEKMFTTQKCLNAHEATCEVKKRLVHGVLQSQKHLSKAKRKRHKDEDVEPEAGPSNQAASDPASPNSLSRDMFKTLDYPSAVSRCSGCQIHLPKQYKDFLPCPSSLADPSSNPLPPSPPNAPTRHAVCFKTIPDKIYPGIPKRDSLEAVTDAPTLQNDDPDLDPSSPSSESSQAWDPDPLLKALYKVCSHPTATIMMSWQYTGSTTKSADELDRLWGLMQNPLFNPKIDTTFSHDEERRHLEKYLADLSNPGWATYGWWCSSVKIPLPYEGCKYASEWDPKIPTLTVDGVYHCDIIDIIISIFKSEDTQSFHILPYEEYWKASEDSEPVQHIKRSIDSHAMC